MKTKTIFLTTLFGIGVGFIIGKLISTQPKTKHQDIDVAIEKVLSKSTDDELSLQKAIDKEDYEQAAVIRDRMKQ